MLGAHMAGSAHAFIVPDAPGHTSPRMATLTSPYQVALSSDLISSHSGQAQKYSGKRKQKLHVRAGPLQWQLHDCRASARLICSIVLVCTAEKCFSLAAPPPPLPGESMHAHTCTSWIMCNC